MYTLLFTLIHILIKFTIDITIIYLSLSPFSLFAYLFLHLF